MELKDTYVVNSSQEELALLVLDFLQTILTQELVWEFQDKLLQLVL
jgi:hypothetical protein